MCDEADLAQDYAQQFADQALQRHAKAHPAQPGRATCIECEEPIAPCRQRIGAIRCMDCEQDEILRQRRSAVQ